MGEAQEVKGAWPSGLTRPLPAAPSRMIEVYQPRLLRMEFQPEPAKPLRQHSHHPLCILLLGEHDDKVIGIPQQYGDT